MPEVIHHKHPEPLCPGGKNWEFYLTAWEHEWQFCPWCGARLEAEGKEKPDAKP